MRKAVLGLVLLAVPAAAEVRTGTFRSEAVGRDVRYVADLPASYATSDGRYPVVYALHGLFEDASFWERRGLSADLAAERSAGRVRDFIVIAVDGGNSFFVNQAGGAYQDLVTRDLVAHVDATVRTIPQRDARGLWGVSMGGYAALRIALAEPGRFAAVATHSAMLLTKPPTSTDGAGRGQMQALARVFGDPIDPGRWAANDPLALAEKADAKALPALRFDCGQQDRYGLAAGQRELERRLTARGVRFEAELPPGDHGYDYVRTVLPKSLRFLGDHLSPPLATGR
jgi:S-formylglutathione hydrolase FrmB